MHQGRRGLESTLLERDLIEAVEGRELQVFVQPQFDATSGSMVGGEALSRWWNARLKCYVSPATFIPLAEKLGLISRIDLFVLETVVREQRSLNLVGADCTWSTNLSPLTLSDDVIERIRGIEAACGPLPTQLEVEITESAVLSAGVQLVSTLRSIRELGFGVAIDDFGAGQTSLSHLSNLTGHTFETRSFTDRED